MLATGFTQSDVAQHSVVRQDGQLRETLTSQHLRVLLILYKDRFVFWDDASRSLIPVVFMQMGDDQRINVEQGVDIDG